MHLFARSGLLGSKGIKLICRFKAKLGTRFTSSHATLEAFLALRASFKSSGRLLGASEVSHGWSTLKSWERTDFSKHYGTVAQNQFILRHLIIHFSRSLQVSEQVSEWAQWSAWAKQAVWTKWVNHASKWKNEWLSKWLSTLFLYHSNQCANFHLLHWLKSCFLLSNSSTFTGKFSNFFFFLQSISH